MLGPAIDAGVLPIPTIPIPMKLLKFLSVPAFASVIFSASAFAEPINATCPVSGRSVDEDHVVAMEVGFCCEKCKAKFDAAPADYFEKVAAAEDGKCPVSGRAVDEDQSSTVNIGVCCEKCEAKVKDDPKSFIAKVEPKKATEEE